MSDNQCVSKSDIGLYQIFMLIVFGFALGFLMPDPETVVNVEAQMEVVADMGNGPDIAGAAVGEDEDDDE